MANEWSVNDELPAKTEKYDWRVPDIDQQHVAQTTAPGDLRIKPKDISLRPTISPKRSGIQHGADDWNFVSDPSGTNAWYVEGSIAQEDD
jgi:hypothetical protein